MTEKVDESDGQSDNLSDTDYHLDLKTSPSCLPETDWRERISSTTGKASSNVRAIVKYVPVHNKSILKKATPVTRRNTVNDTPKNETSAESVDLTTQTNVWRIFPIVVLALIVYFVFNYIPYPYSATCDMKKAENRDFNRFYGIQDLRNHFTTTAADACDSDIIFKSVLPQAVLKPDHSASSFMIFAKYGTGKTALRCEYFKSLDSTKYLKVLILNKQINEYLERFVSGTSTDGRDCDSRNCLVGWSKNEFAPIDFIRLGDTIRR